MANNASEFLFIYTVQLTSSIPKTITHVIVDATVTAIEANAFDGCTKLVNVELHEGLESIGEYAFCSCVSLADVQLNNGLKTIGDADSLSISKYHLPLRCFHTTYSAAVPNCCQLN